MPPSRDLRLARFATTGHETHHLVLISPRGPLRITPCDRNGTSYRLCPPVGQTLVVDAFNLAEAGRCAQPAAIRRAPHPALPSGRGPRCPNCASWRSRGQLIDLLLRGLCPHG